MKFIIDDGEFNNVWNKVYDSAADETIKRIIAEDIGRSKNMANGSEFLRKMIIKQIRSLACKDATIRELSEGLRIDVCHIPEKGGYGVKMDLHMEKTGFISEYGVDLGDGCGCKSRTLHIMVEQMVKGFKDKMSDIFCATYREYRGEKTYNIDLEDKRVVTSTSIPDGIVVMSPTTFMEMMNNQMVMREKNIEMRELYRRSIDRECGCRCRCRK